MTREQCIEAMARAIDPDAWDGEVDDFKRYLQACGIEEATAAYDDLLPHIQAERERVREMCAAHLEGADTFFKHEWADAASVIRALDIGGQNG